MPEYTEQIPTKFFENKEAPLVKDDERKEYAEQAYIDSDKRVQTVRQQLADLKLAKSLTGVSSLEIQISKLSAAVIFAEEAARLKYRKEEKVV